MGGWLEWVLDGMGVVLWFWGFCCYGFGGFGVLISHGGCFRVG